ncbi:aspartic peptidase domain-containing protein [Mycena rebaudengoi]|nr:aspartic peptidase domain-containing protein [Mycena rebaudengoi]
MPVKNHFIGVSLPRTDDPKGSATGPFSINEVDPAPAAPPSAPSLPLLPGNNSIWSIVLDSMSVDNVTVTLPPSTVSGTPSGKVVAMLDTGTPNGLFHQQQLDAIYSKIPGAVNATIQPGVKKWTIPCNTMSSLALHFGPSQSIRSISRLFSLTQTTIRYAPPPWDASDETAPFDMILGDSFMRNFYTIFNFDISQTPNALSQTDAAAAAKDAVQVRTALLANFSASAQSKTGSDKCSGTSPSAPMLAGPLFAGFLSVAVQSF